MYAFSRFIPQMLTISAYFWDILCGGFDLKIAIYPRIYLKGT